MINSNVLHKRLSLLHHQQYLYWHLNKLYLTSTENSLYFKEFNKFEGILICSCLNTNSIQTALHETADICNIEYDQEIESAMLSCLINMVEEGYFTLIAPHREAIKNIYGEINTNYPERLIFELTDRCNLRCSHCYRNANNGSGKDIEIERVIHCLESLKYKMRCVDFTGGEPFLYPKWELLAQYLDSYYVSVLSNGVVMPENPDAILPKIDYLQVSLYGPNDKVFNAITNSNGFSRFRENIKLAASYGIKIGASLIVNQYVLQNLEEYIEFLSSNAISSLRCGFAVPIGRLSKNSSDFWQLTCQQRILFNEIYNRLREKYSESIYMHPLDHQDIEVNYGFKESLSLQCDAGHGSVVVSPDGFVRPCVYFDQQFYQTTPVENWLCLIGKNAFSFSSQTEKYINAMHSNGMSMLDVCNHGFAIKD